MIGTGYVGLVTGTCLAEIGHHVICVDNNAEKIAGLKKKKIPIYEPGLEPLVLKNIKAKRLTFTTSIKEGVKKSDFIFIGVSTPPKANGQADLSFVAQVAREVAHVMDAYKVIVDKSTVPVRTAEKVKESIKRYNIKKIDFDIVSNPEFLREGSAVDDFMHPDRIVIGVESKRAEKMMQELYAPIKAPLIITNVKSAEIIKHASNSFLALKISFANALANICELAGADIHEVVEGMGHDKRINKAFLNAGVGYGGSCFPKDVSAFIKISQDLGYEFKLLKEVEKINELQKEKFISKIEETLWTLKDKTIGVLGLAFKPNTDDMRNAPSIDIIHHLEKEGARVKAYDPVAMDNAKAIMNHVHFEKNIYDVAKGSDALIIVTEWDEFKKMDLKRIRKLLTHPIVIDGRNIFDPEKMDSEGFVYKSIGR